LSWSSKETLKAGAYCLTGTRYGCRLVNLGAHPACSADLQLEQGVQSGDTALMAERYRTYRRLTAELKRLTSVRLVPAKEVVS
jgi:hypothetical protein